MTEYETFKGESLQPPQEQYKPSWRMCQLAEKGKLDRLRQLAANPTLMCKNCGRIAEREKNLCKPIGL